MKEVTVYKARYDGAEVVVDFRIVESLDGLSQAITDGWHSTEAAAREAVGPAPVPAAVYETSEPTVETVSDTSEELTDYDPEPTAPKRTARKKR